MEVSIDSAGQSFSAVNTVPMISGDGRYMVFTTLDDLTPGSASDFGSGQDVFVKDLLNGKFELISGGMERVNREISCARFTFALLIK
jgi:Tol biopolymer transport system component